MKTNRKFRRFARFNHRAYVGPKGLYDMKGAWQFMILCLLGLREKHYLLEIGCGSLRAARLFIPYLLPRHYAGLDANQEAVENGIKSELGNSLIDLKKPVFTYNGQFNMTLFGAGQFDYILSHSVIMHIPSHAVGTMMSQAARVLSPTGVFVGSFVAGDVKDKKTATYPEAVWHNPSVIRLAVQTANMIYMPLALAERHPAVRWFLAAHPGHAPKILDGESVTGMLNKYWQWEKRRGK